MKQAAKAMELPLQWGGDWKNFRDGPHFELPRECYP
ncbi:M15 family metallopeptidase, partial [Yersinia pestis]